MKERIPEIGDIVAVRWRDHYRYQGEDPHRAMEVISWGKVETMNEDGIALIQNEVQNEGPVHKVMDGQFILKESIVEVRKL